MKYELHESSPQAKALITGYEDKIGTFEQQRGPREFPWNQMAIGQSFIVGNDKITLAALKNRATVKKFANGKIFKIIEHKQFKIFEVARIA